MVSISKSEIRDNDGTGIYSERRKLSITDNEIRDNDGDGIDIEDGSSAWIADNTISSNDKSGMKLRIDGSEIWTKSNTIKNNDREGIEISYKGVAGRINIAKTKIMNNKKYGIAKVQRFVGGYPSSAWGKYLTFDTRNSITGNGSGNISPVIIVK
jgi:parallel beta-helix repeat protein